MRTFAAAVLIACTALPGFAADKNEDKAREAAVAYMKAMKARDADAALKVADVPFGYRDGDTSAVIKDTAALKKWLKEKIEEIKDADAVPTEVKTLVAFAQLKEKVKDSEQLKAVEDVIGKDGFIVMFITPDEKMLPILVRMRDGKAKIVGVGR
jgi:hypothetical protein